MKTHRLITPLLVVAIGSLVSAAVAQDMPPPAPVKAEMPLSTLLELVRTDLKVEKVEIVSEVMELTVDEASAFWDVYREYDARMSRYWEGRLALILAYSENYDNLTDEVAADLADRAIELEILKVSIKVEYFARMRAATSAHTALRFFQLEGQLQSVAEFQISSQLPFVPKRPKAE